MIADQLIKYGIIVSPSAHGNVKVRCPKCQASRQKHPNDVPLSVNVDTGKWKCHHCGKFGNAEHGWSDDSTAYFENKVKQPKEYKKPESVKIVPLPQEVITYFEGRGITQDVLKRNKISYGKFWFPQAQKEMNGILFGYYDGEELINIKARRNNPERMFAQSKDAKPIPYKINDIRGQKEIGITEGEVDCLSWEVAGLLNFVSSPGGAINENDKQIDGKLQFLEHIQKEVEQAKWIYIATDSDAPGRRFEYELARRIGRDKCKRIKYPDDCKDANDVLVKHGGEALKKCYDNAEPYPIDGLIQFSDIVDDIVKIYTDGFRQSHSTGVKTLDEIYTIREGELTVVTGVPSHGKALDIETEIPTINGFKKMRDIVVGDKVFDELGVPCNVIGMTGIMLNRECYEMTFSDGSKVICDAQHEWFTRTDKARRSLYYAKKNGRDKPRALKPKGNDQTHKRSYPEVITTEKIAESVYIENRKRFNHGIMLALPVQYPKRDLPIDPYVLGCWIGDGTKANGLITKPDQELFDEIERRGYKTSPRADKRSRCILGLQMQLRGLGLLNNKHIPEIYLNASIEQRMELLQGLMDTDGYCSDIDNRCEFCQIDKNIAEQVYQLVASLGIRATMIECDAMLNGRFISKKYRVFFTTSKPVFKLKRKLKNLADKNDERRKWRFVISCRKVKSVPVKCIQVDSPSKLYLCTKSYIPTHNSTLVNYLITHMVKSQQWKFGVYSVEHHPLERYFANLARIYVGKPFMRGPTERMSNVELFQAIAVLNEYIKPIYPISGERKLESILNLARTLVYRHGIKGLVIDPWNRIEHERSGRDLADYVAATLDRIQDFGRRNDIHTWIVAHPKLLQMTKDGTFAKPTLYTISGGANWRNCVDHGLIVWRDIEKGDNVVEIYAEKIKYEEIGQIARRQILYDKITGRYYDMPNFKDTNGKASYVHYSETEREYDVYHKDQPPGLPF